MAPPGLVPLPGWDRSPPRSRVLPGRFARCKSASHPAGGTQARWGAERDEQAGWEGLAGVEPHLPSRCGFALPSRSRGCPFPPRVCCWPRGSGRWGLQERGASRRPPGLRLGVCTVPRARREPASSEQNIFAAWRKHLGRRGQQLPGTARRGTAEQPGAGGGAPGVRRGGRSSLPSAAWGRARAAPPCAGESVRARGWAHCLFWLN